MRSLFGSVFVVCCFVFISCQKEVDWSQPTTPQADSLLIAKFILLDTTLPSGQDTIQKSLFEYDGQKRMVKMYHYYKDQSLPPSTVYTLSDSISIFYTGNDTVPSKVIRSTIGILDNSRDTLFLFYTAGQVTRDSIRSVSVSNLPPPMPPVESIKVNTFADNGNITNVNMRIAYTLSPSSWPPPCPATIQYQKTYVNGNITYEFGNYSDCNGIGTSESGHFTFDTKPNPGYAYSVPYPILDNEFHLTESKNNIVGVWYNTPGDGFQQTFTYRSDGYPLIVRGFDQTDPTLTWKGLYIYK